MSAARVLSLVGVLLVVAGLVTGFMPVSAQGTNCGSAFHASRDAEIADLTNAMEADSAGVSLFNVGSTAEACSSLRSTVRIPAVVLLVLGGCVLLVRVVKFGTPPPPPMGDSAESTR
ncbi:MAG: hypothetical protein J2P17_04900 [Mycobacterium sp.]|nr:hypothetical protein [Mycobacterium sp.]